MSPKRIQAIISALDLRPGIDPIIRAPGLADILQEHYGACALDDRQDTIRVALFILDIIQYLPKE